MREFAVAKGGNMNIELQWEFEDEFIECFTNGISGQIAHSDSYMTVLDFDKAEDVFDKVRDKYADNLEEIFDNLKSSDNEPALRLLGIHLSRKNKEKCERLRV